MTKEWFKFLSSLSVQVKNDWADSVFVGETADLTIQLNSHAIGKLDTLKQLTETTYEEVVETIYDSKQ
jgi:hypothetical protein